MIFPSSRLPLLAALAWLAGASAPVFGEDNDSPPKREPVHPRRNVEEFPAVETAVLRFTILKTTGQQPCLDELEVYGPDDPERNLALAENGTRASASGTLAGYRIHALSHVNDGLYGNGHSWISDTPGGGWVELRFPAPVRVNRVVWSRDRERKFIDRLPLEYRIDVALEPGNWQTVASSSDRAAPPVEPDAELSLFGITGYSSTPAGPPGQDRPAAREYLLRTWQTADGLPSNTVTALLQTRDGWLWIGTTNGLARFDGVRFTTFDETSGLPGLNVTALFEDVEGVLWAGTADGGLVFFKGGRFHAVRIGPDAADNGVASICQDSEGRVWAGTGGGLFRRDGMEFVRHAPGPVSKVVPDAEGGVWFIGPGNEMLRWDGEKVERAAASLEDPSRFSSVSALAAGPDGALWFGGANGYVGRLANGTVTTLGEKQSVLTSSALSLLPVTDGDVWVGTSATGLARLRDGDPPHLTTDDGLPSNSVTSLCQDREGNVWAGTAGGGLTRLRPRLVRAVTTSDGLSHNSVTALLEDAEGSVWIGTGGGGLNRWRGETVEPYAPNYVLENRVISSLAATRDGALWMGIPGAGVFRMAGGKLSRFSRKDGLPGGVVAAMCEDSAGRLWMGSRDGGAVYHFEGTFTAPPELEPLRGVPVTAILEDRAGRLWFGTAGGGAARLENGRLARWTRDTGLTSGFIRTLREDSAGNVWAGTGSGLTRWTPDDALFHFTTRHGLPDATISQILEDGEGHLWLGTNRGVVRVSRRSLGAVASGKSARLQTMTLNTADGLPSLECTGGFHPAGLRLRDGRLCFATVAGLAVVDPAMFSTPPPPPPVVIESVVSGSGGPPAVPAPGESLTLPASGRLEVRFTALSLTAPERARLRYRLAGLEIAWTESGSERSAAWASLPPGDFRFEVQAGHGDEWGAETASVALRVLTPWWRAPGALALGALTVTGAAAGLARAVTRRRMQRRLRAVEQQFALERERTRIARDIHDDLGASLTQIGLLSALGQEQSHRPEAARERFAAIAATAGELAQAMDAIVWAVNPRHDTLESLARYLVRFSGDFFARAPARLRLDVPEELPDVPLTSEARHSVFLAAKEALNNTLAHANAKEVHLRLNVEKDRFTLAIEDDGAGFDPATVQDGGNGLDNMRQRLSECGGTCEIVSAPGTGTTVRFTLPLS